MDEEIGIKVTRLRRKSQLPLEEEDTKSPSTQSTPTKKRGGRLAAKPQLELIDENATEGEKPKKTRKSIARDIESEEKPITPSRRSTRIRSNTSNISETPAEAEDKGTPARRSTRIRSNTSIVAETIQYGDSPRARRAARRTSQVGSDNETAITPIRQTSRPKKDSTSSIDKQDELDVSKSSMHPKVIIEKNDNDTKENKNERTPTKNVNDSPAVKKSLRLVQKTGQRNSSQDDNNKANELQTVKVFGKDEKSVLEIKTDDMEQSLTMQTEQKEIVKENTLSISTSNLMNEMAMKFEKGNTGLNETTSAIDKPKPKSKRHRTKSWTTISSGPSSDSYFMSDTEVLKKKNVKKSSMSLIVSGSGDSVLNSSKHETSNDFQKYQKEEDFNKLESFNPTTKPERQKKSQETPTRESPSATEPAKLNKSIGNLRQSSEGKKFNVLNKSKISFTETILASTPSGHVESIVFIDDSDSNTSTNNKAGVIKETDNEDQCVPVIKQQLEASQSKNNLSCEPMDIDETVPENASLSYFTENNTTLQQRKSDSIFQNNSQTRSIMSNIKSDNDTIMSETKSSTFNDGDLENKSIRKPSISTPILDPCTEDNAKVFKKQAIDTKYSMSNTNNDDSIIDKSKQTTLISNISEMDSTSAIHKDNLITLKSSEVSNTENKFYNNNNIVTDHKSSKRKLSISNVMTSNDNIDNSSNVAEVESLANNNTVIHEDSETSNKIKCKTIPSNMEDDKSNESANKALRKSVSHIELQASDNNINENKSTLVWSQSKDDLDDNKESNEQLSKSLNIPNVNKDTDKKNLSLTYSTSTPLQKSSKKKIGMQLNTSIITQSSVSKKKKKGIFVVAKAKPPVCRNYNRSSSSNEEDKDDSGEEGSVHKSILDQEAEEASDDYESGDSRDDNEKEYEEQNEIVENGETLDSEDEDFSDDSEYEKGSFIVDSDGEDNELLSGSGDDLSMSAVELNMSAKSKNKFNERKIKEQKKASREMFESRHKLNESNKSMKSEKPKLKKVNRQRLESTDESEFEEEAVVPAKKKRSARIDSSQDLSMSPSDADNSIFSKKKKVRCLSESLCEDAATSEKEISIQHSVEADKEDPLSLYNVKEEPKTPQQRLNISTIAIINAEGNKEVDLQKNVFTAKLKSNETSDLLEHTAAQDDTIDSDETISECEEIVQNYESVLSDLNTKSKNIKIPDLSLNLDKKKKKRVKEQVVNDLTEPIPKNFKSESTETRSSKIFDFNQSFTKKSVEKCKEFNNIHSEGSSDSIDMKLLFDENSTDNETKIAENKQVPENFIPLKRTEGKTNILESIDLNNSLAKNNAMLNLSKLKDDKHKSSQPVEAVTIVNEEAENLGFFVDTTGALTDKSNSVTVNDTSIKASGKKKKQKNKISSVNIEEARDDDNSNDAPLQISYQNEKNKNKSKQDMDTTQNDDISGNGTSNKKKKKSKKSVSSSELSVQRHNIEGDDSNAVALENSYQSEKNKDKSKLDVDTAENGDKTEVTPKKNGTTKKRNKRSLDNSQLNTEDQSVEVNEEAENLGFFVDTTGALTDKSNSVIENDTSIKASGKKKKQKNEMSSINIEDARDDDNSNDAPLEVSYQSEKNKNKSKQDMDTTQNDDIKENGTSNKNKKKNNKSIDGSELSVQKHTIKNADSNATTLENSYQSEKNTDKSKLKEDTTQNEDTTPIKSEKTKKKNKRSLDNSQLNAEEQSVKAEERSEVSIRNVSHSSDKKQKQKNNTADCAVEKESTVEDEKVVINEKTMSRKHKRKLAANHSIGQTEQGERDLDTSKALNDSIITTNQKKKRKVCEQHEESNSQAQDTAKKNKKRKDRDFDDGEKISKINKQNSFDKVYVPRLPTNVLKELDDKLTKGSDPKPDIISTTSFKVEQAKQRRNKPSNYLEQSVYLNDSLEERKKKPALKKPKVLPFIPTASTSEFGFTTKFRVNVIPQETQFVSQSSDISNFKKDYLQKNRIKKLGTFELYKKHRNIKISKF